MPGKKGLHWSDLRENYKEEVNRANEGDCVSGSQVVIGTWLIFSALETWSAIMEVAAESSETELTTLILMA